MNEFERVLDRRPIAVLISDVHYNIHTLEVADKAMKLAFDRANLMGIPLIVCGDLHDTKAHLRAECVKAILNVVNDQFMHTPIILRGNHDSINEKTDSHALGFLEIYCSIVKSPRTLSLLYPYELMPTEEEDDSLIYFIPYHHDLTVLRAHLKTIPKGSTIIMHQGVVGTEAGHYFQDKTALNPEDLAGFRVISGHYHRRQSFPLPEGGRFDYVGNPYTLGFGEATDPAKGFQILFSDGTLQFIPTNLRQHRIIELDVHNITPIPTQKTDILWIKIKGSSDELAKITKQDVAKRCELEQSFKLDLIPVDTKSDKVEMKESDTKEQVLDSIIDSLANTDESRKARLKLYYKQFLGDDK